MKIIAFSDSHGCRNDLIDAIGMARKSGPIDVCVHCGDGAEDFEFVQRILLNENPGIQLYSVRGNCDLSALTLPYTAVFNAGGVRFLATHGLPYGVKSGYSQLLDAARAQKARVALFGHTHLPLVEERDGVWLVNPGAICNRRAGRPAFAQVTVDASGAVIPELVNWIV